MWHAKFSEYLNDILVTGKTSMEHYENFEEFLTRLKAAGMRLNEQSVPL